MENERKKALIESMKKFNKEKEDSLLDFAINSDDKEIVPSGIETVDNFIGGGYKKGTFTVIYGAESTGKSTLVLHSISNAQKLNLNCCYIDMEHSFDKERAIQLGINLNDLVLVQSCKTAEDALSIIRSLCKDKVIDLFAVDSVQALSPINQQESKVKGGGSKIRELEEKEIAELARLLSKFFQVVAPDVFRAKAAVIMVGQVRIGGIGTFFTKATMSGGEAIKHWANTRIFMRRGQTADAPTEKIKKIIQTPDGEHKKTENIQIGFDAVLKLEKTKSSQAAQEGSEIHIPFYYVSGFKKIEKQEETEQVAKPSNVEVKDVPESSPEKEIPVTVVLKKRGRKAKSITETQIEGTDEQQVRPSSFTDETPKKKKSRGRPKKVK